MIKTFSKKKFMELETQEEYLDNKFWVDDCDGKKLTKSYESGDGMIRNYFIAKEWIEEAND